MRSFTDELFIILFLFMYFSSVFLLNLQNSVSEFRPILLSNKQSIYKKKHKTKTGFFLQQVFKNLK